MPMRLTTTAFTPGGTIPSNFTGEGANKSPMFRFEDAPAETKSFALLMEDPDVPGEPFCHWLMYDIPVDVVHLEPSLGRLDTFDNNMKQGLNDFGDIGYSGPLPPPGKRHQYVFRLFALRNAPGELRAGIDKHEFLDWLDNKADVLERAELSVFY
jgi:Raf kinase inhibitor-like YbhB/YbcL family protein